MDYVIHWTQGQDEDATVVTGCELADDAQFTFSKQFPDREIRHIFRVSETIASDTEPEICENCGEEMKHYITSPTGDDTTLIEVYGCLNCDN